MQVYIMLGSIVHRDYGGCVIGSKKLVRELLGKEVLQLRLQRIRPKSTRRERGSIPSAWRLAYCSPLPSIPGYSGPSRRPAGRNGTPRPWVCCCGRIGLASRVLATISDGSVDGLSLGISIVSSTRKSVESNCVQKSSRSRYDARRGSAKTTRLGTVLTHFVYFEASLWQTGCSTSSERCRWNESSRDRNETSRNPQGGPCTTHPVLRYTTLVRV